MHVVGRFASPHCIFCNGCVFLMSLVLLYRIRSPGSVSVVVLSSACVEKVVSFMSLTLCMCVWELL